ncbi:MAG TPA: hypothetical protein VG406_15650 [Isosphaeraceae bacterium]|jgi:hypothetical protein|nr:hypothetical protein [Isosphaeraceae bacterium]
MRRAGAWGIGLVAWVAWPWAIASGQATPTVPAPTPPAPTAPRPVPPPTAPRFAPARNAPGENDGSFVAPPITPNRGRPRPGSPFDPGATGPGINPSGEDPFLDGALDPRSGWPFVFLDHFRPRNDRVRNLWIVQTRDCPQVMGSDPWPCLRVLHFDDRGRLVRRSPAELFAQAVGHPVFIQVQGSLTTPDIALGGLLWSRSWLEHNGAMPKDAVVIAFDWPSQRVYRHDVRDINEKGRRAYVAGYHLARFLQGFPAGSRICVLGQSYGGRVVPSALHLLGGGCLNSQDHDPPVRLPGLRRDLRVRAVVIAGASDHDWLDPGQRLDHALLGCEMLLNLYNRRDEALRLYPFLVRSGHRRALGRVGLTNRDLDRLGPLASRYAERDIHDDLGTEHSLLDAVANREIARVIAPYNWSPDPGPGPPEPPSLPPEDEVRPYRIGRILRVLRAPFRLLPM